MININGKLLDELNANEYYLFSILLNYGTKSRPDNGVLMHRTGWGLQKLQNTKKSLVNKGIVEVNAKFDRKEKGRGRASNEYKIKTRLASKYNGVQLHDFHVIEIQLDENKVIEIQLDDFKIDENQVYNKVLKYSIIETIKLLKEESVKEKDTHIKELENKLENALLELEKLKNQKEKPKKIAPKKGKHEFPDNTPRKSYTVPKTEQQQTKPYEIFLNNYPFNGWSEKLKENFILYCEVKNDYNNGRYSSTQIKMRIAEIVAGIDKHEMIWLEKLVLAAANGSNGGWASFEFDTRIKERKEKKQKDENKQQANNGKSMFENYADSLSDNWSEDENGTVDTTWEEM